jgi:isopentenyl-diphosphate delta-isomerase
VSREVRKLDHINHALSTGQATSHGFQDLTFLHNSIPEIHFDDISLSSKIGELYLSSPFFINAMTGGGGMRTRELNQQLAEVAAETKIGMAVGSQMAAIKDKDQRSSFEIVRKKHPKGIIFANLGSEATVDQAKEAVEMIEADAFQLHLNVIQELVMPEGDRDFTNTYKRIEKIVNEIDVPVIVKEVGFGMSKETVRKLASIGVSIVDIGGFGGTNFAKIENERRRRRLGFFEDWGITTACSLLEVLDAKTSTEVVSSGGLQTALDLAKSIALGASAGGFAGRFLKILVEEGQQTLVNEINGLNEDLKIILGALGVRNLKELQKVPIIITGDTYHWAVQRGINLTSISQR